MTVFLPVTASAQEMAVLSGPRTQERSEALSRIHSRVLGLVSMAGDGVVVAVDPALVEALGVTTASLEQAARNSGSQPATPDGAPQSPQSADPSASSAPSAPSAPSTTGPSASPAPSPQSGGTATASPSDKKASQASNEVIQLSAALARAIHTDSLVALPWGDSDTAALAHLQQTGLIETAARRTQESAIVKAGPDVLDLVGLQRRGRNHGQCAAATGVNHHRLTGVLAASRRADLHPFGSGCVREPCGPDSGAVPVGGTHR